MTVTLYDYIQSELIKKGQNEFVDAKGNLVFFNEDFQFMTKIFNYDEEVSSIVDRLFTGVSLTQYEHDMHFKKAFLYRFANRHIGRQTIEAFRQVLLSTFLVNKAYINTVYTDLEKYLHQHQQNENSNTQKNVASGDSESTTDNRSAFANLPQNNVQLDVDNTIMTTASDNTVARNKQKDKNSSLTDSSGRSAGDSQAYNLETLLKSNGMEERIFDEFDRKCFKQTW